MPSCQIATDVRYLAHSLASTVHPHEDAVCNRTANSVICEVGTGIWRSCAGPSKMQILLPPGGQE